MGWASSVPTLLLLCALQGSNTTVTVSEFMEMQFGYKFNFRGW
jgi:hypothetical protein